ncbi:MAG: uracil phosphoribosyltransferase [Rhodothermales bacterium]|nr:uracil phosphoribosyltransferase [Rhodothermales bacterium]
MTNVTVVNHPLLKRDITILRRAETPHGVFRKTLSDASAILAYEVMRDIGLGEVVVQGPLEESTGFVVKDTVVVVPIMRAGLGMVDGFIRFIPEARVGHLGMYRDEDTLTPVDYYSSLPENIENARTFVVDPMLATGGSATGAIQLLKDKGAINIAFVCLLAAPEGVEKLGLEHPDVPIVTASLEERLDENAFIRPGLGDAGDRIFGTA